MEHFKGWQSVTVAQNMSQSIFKSMAERPKSVLKLKLVMKAHLSLPKKLSHFSTQSVLGATAVIILLLIIAL